MTRAYNIELKDFDTIFVAGHLTKPFSVSWSEDDRIAILVDDGVQIFELYPTPLSDQLTITFLRSWIPASTNLPFQTVFDNKANSLVWNLKRQEVYEMAIDSTLTSLVEKSVVSSFIIQCIFSPLIYNESYISCLTNNGHLEIYKWDLNKWRPLMNVSELWIKYCRAKNNYENIDYNLLKQKMCQLKIMTMAWLEKPKLFFLTGHEDGGICIWNVDTSSESLRMNVYYYFHITGKPSCIGVCEIVQKQIFLFMFGTLLGQVEYILFKSSDDVKLERFGNVGELWKHEDFIKPTLIHSETINNDRYIFTIKNHIVVIQNIIMNEDNEVDVLKTDWHEFSAPIISFNKYQNEFIIGLRNHEFLTLTINETGYEVKKNVELPLRPKHSSCFHCFGLAMSKNKAIWIVASSAKVNYDAKTMKDTVHLLIFIPKLKLFKSLTDTTCTGLIKEIMKLYKTTRLTEISDLLELKKCELLTDPSNYTDNITFDFTTSPFELKLIIWEAKLRIFTQSAEIQNIVSECEYLLALQWCTNRRLNYLNLQPQLTNLQRRSLEIMEIFLKETKSNMVKEVECAICNGLAPIENIRISSCSNLHIFPRCSLSLLPCDSIPYAFCRLCDSATHPDFMSDNDYRCLYCDGLLVPDTRAR